MENMKTINEDTVKRKWKEIQGEVQKMWGRLTNDELQQTKGNFNAISGLVQQRYGESKETFQQKFADIVSRVENKAREVLIQSKDDNSKGNSHV